PMGDILDRLQARFGRNIEGNVAAQQALDDAFGSGADVIKKLWGQQEMLNRSISALGRNDGMKRATEMAEAMTDPWDRLVASFYNIRAAIGNALYPILAPLAGRFADIGATFVRWLNMFPNIARWLGYITLTMLALGAAGAVTNIVLGVFSFIMEGHKAIIKGARA
ncbi:TPA: phage tail tape measure protein, partial [Escherichia coli]|nr:phage tail tape measure protein [Escherichia coli]